MEAPRGGGRIGRLETLLLAFFSACWLVLVLAYAGVVRLAGTLDLSLYQVYGLASCLGWVAGNIFVLRGSGLPGPLRRRLGLVYLLGPASVPALVRALAPLADRMAAPLVPLWAFGVYFVFFAVPITFRRRPPR